MLIFGRVYSIGDFLKLLKNNQYISRHCPTSRDIGFIGKGLINHSVTPKPLAWFSNFVSYQWVRRCYFNILFRSPLGSIVDSINGLSFMLGKWKGQLDKCNLDRLYFFLAPTRQAASVKMHFVALKLGSRSKPFWTDLETSHWHSLAGLASQKLQDVCCLGYISLDFARFLNMDLAKLFLGKEGRAFYILWDGMRKCLC